MKGRLRQRPGRYFSALPYLLILATLMVVAAGCDAFPWTAGVQKEPSPAAIAATPSPEGGLAPTRTADISQTPELPAEPAGGQADLLRLWLPPKFDPNADTAAGKVLRARLEQFRARYPDLRLDIRIKAENGPGGLLAALSAASVSAPLTLPDVVALPRPLLEAAALKGVVYPMDGLPVAEVDGFLTETDWYPYAVQMGRLQDNTFGLPFASDLVVMAGRSPSLEGSQSATPALQPTQPVESTQEPALPVDWVRFFESETKLAFPAADPQALFTLLLYRSLGGPWTDPEGRPYLDAAVLEQVLAFYQLASRSGILPDWLSQVETDEQAWAAFESGEAAYLVTWATQALAAAGQSEVSLVAEAAPAQAGQPYTLATGWVWAVASPDPLKRALAGELAAFLVESTFLSEWNSAAGYLPPRTSALAGWEPSAWRSLVNEISVGAELLPPGDVLPVLGPPLRQATVDVLKLQVEPAAAAQAAVLALKNP